MTITLHGTNGITTPAVAGDGSDLTALPAAQLTGTVATSQIADANVTTAKIADANVTTAKITDANVTTAKITDANVTTAKIADANVTQGKLADQAVNEAKMQVSNAPTNGYFLSAQSGNTGGMTWAEAGGDPTGSSAEATLSATSLTMTGIPAEVQWIRVMLNNVRIQGDADLRIYMGIADGTYNTSGYTHSLSLGQTNTIPTDEDNGRWFMLVGGNTYDRFYGFVEITRVHTTNTWLSSYCVACDDGSRTQVVGGGQITMSAELTQIKLQISGGSVAMDGKASLVWGY